MAHRTTQAMHENHLACLHMCRVHYHSVGCVPIQNQGSCLFRIESGWNWHQALRLVNQLCFCAVDRQTRHWVALLKPGASRAVCLHSADEAVAWSQWRFLLKWVSASAHVDVRARKSGELHSDLHFFRGRSWNVFVDDNDL